MKKSTGFAVIEITIIVVVVVVVATAGVTFAIHRTSAHKANQLAKATTTPVVLPTTSSTPTPVKTVQTSTLIAPTSTPTIRAYSPTPALNTPVSISAARVAEMYNISADGQSARESPVTTQLSTSGNVNLVVNLTCASACQFKLVSDNYPLPTQATYTGSQNISYTLTQHGSWNFYNEFTPNTKFLIKF